MKHARRSLPVLRIDFKPRRITQRRVAQDAHLTLTRYWQIENGYGHPPTPDEQQAIAKALGVPVTAIEWPHRMAKAS